MKKIVVILLAIIILVSSSMAFAADETTNIIGDSLILRPLGIVITVAGSILFVITLPMSAIAKSTDKTYNALVKRPYEFTFKRQVGDMESGLEDF